MRYPRKKEITNCGKQLHTKFISLLYFLTKNSKI